MLVVMACTMAIAAPITMVVGVIMALRQDVGLSIVLVFAMPIAAIVLGMLVSRMVPAFRLMQERIDQVNRVLREQITGIRVVRAFVREPQEARRFADANADLTDVSLRGRPADVVDVPDGELPHQRCRASPCCGSARSCVNSGEIEVGTLVAYLTYLVQILMSVVMATFMVSMIPRASVSADRIQEVLDTEPSVVPPADPVREVVTPRRARVPRRRLPLPGRRARRCSATSRSRPRRADDGDRRQHRRGQDDARQPHPAAVRQHRGQGARRRRRRPRPRPRRAVEHDRLRPAAPVPLLGHGGEQPAVRQARRDRGRDVGGARGRAGRATSCAAMPGGLDARIEQGGTNVSGGQRQRLSIARALIRRPDIYVFDDSFSALDLATDARLRAALGAVHAGRRGRDRRPAGVDDRDRRQHPRARGRRGHRPRHARRAHRATARPTPRSCSRRSARRARGMTHHRRSTSGRDEEVDLSAPDDRAAGPVELGRRARRAVEGLRARAAPPGRHARPDAGRARASSLVARGHRARRSTCSARACSATAPTSSSQGVQTTGRHRLRRAAPRAVPGDRRSTRASAVLSIIAAYMLAGVVQRLMFRLRSEVEDKVNALPLSYIDKQQRGDLLSRVTNDIDNVAQSLQQTLSQMLTSVLLLIGVAIMMFTISPLLAVVALTTVPVSVCGMRVDRRAGPAQVHLAVEAAPATLNAQIEETFTGHAVVKAFGRQREVEQRFRETNDELYESSFGAQFMSSLMQPLDDVHGQRPVRDRRGRRRPAGRERRDHRRRHPGVHPVLAHLLDAAHAARVDDERLPVGHRLVRAGDRVPRRRGAEPRAGRDRRPRRRSRAASSSATSRSPTTPTARSSSHCRSSPSRARRSPSSARPARARPRS